MTPYAGHHIPALLKETIDGLVIRPNGRYIDATLGAGGHAEAILKRLELLGSDGVVLGIDRDRRSLELSGERLKQYGKRFMAVQGNFRDIKAIARERGLNVVDGIVVDLGFSSMQIDMPERGFSFRHRAFLDMRMDQGQPLTARDVVNEYSREELIRIFRELGEERRAVRIAGAIAERRKEQSIEMTDDLAEIVSRVYGRTGGRIHPATLVFQALRIHVNQEIENLTAVVPDSVDQLQTGGRLAIISYHSLEDRLVKDAYRFLSGKCRCPGGQPICNCGALQRVKIITRRPIRPSDAEVRRNRRARSAKLRLAEKVGGVVH